MSGNSPIPPPSQVLPDAPRFFPPQAPSPPDFDLLVERISAASDALRQAAVLSVNRAVTARAWLTGCYIVEYEQHGRDRAQYGERLLSRLAERLAPGEFSVGSLKKFRLFYKTYPDLEAPVAAFVLSRLGIGQSPILQLPLPPPGPKGESLIPQSATPSLLLETSDGVSISPQALFSRLSYTHILQLLPLPDPLQRTFYAFSAIRGTWSVRELRRQIESRCFERSGWSRDPAKLAAQLSVYMAHYRKHEMAPDDNPPVGILLCTEVGAETAEYVSTFVEPGLFVSKYEVQLPPRERIAAFLKRENAALSATPTPEPAP